MRVVRGLTLNGTISSGRIGMKRSLYYYDKRNEQPAVVNWSSPLTHFFLSAIASSGALIPPCSSPQSDVLGSEYHPQWAAPMAYSSVVSESVSRTDSTYNNDISKVQGCGTCGWWKRCFMFYPVDHVGLNPSLRCPTFLSCSSHSPALGSVGAPRISITAQRLGVMNYLS